MEWRGNHVKVPCCCSLGNEDASLSGEARGDTSGEADTKGENIPSPPVDRPIGSPIIPASPPVAAASNNAFNCDSRRIPPSEGVAGLFCLIVIVDSWFVTLVVVCVATHEEDEEEDGKYSLGWTMCCDGAPDVIALIAVFLKVFILNKLPTESSLVALLTERGDASESME